MGEGRTPRPADASAPRAAYRWTVQVAALQILAVLGRRQTAHQPINNKPINMHTVTGKYVIYVCAELIKTDDILPLLTHKNGNCIWCNLLCHKEGEAFHE